MCVSHILQQLNVQDFMQTVHFCVRYRKLEVKSLYHQWEDKCFSRFPGVREALTQGC